MNHELYAQCKKYGVVVFCPVSVLQGYDDLLQINNGTIKYLVIFHFLEFLLITKEAITPIIRIPIAMQNKERPTQPTLESTQELYLVLDSSIPISGDPQLVNVL